MTGCRDTVIAGAQQHIEKGEIMRLMTLDMQHIIHGWPDRLRTARVGEAYSG